MTTLVTKSTPKLGDSLWKISDEYREACDAVAVDTSTGEVIGWEKVDALQDKAIVKAQNICRYIQSVEAFSEEIGQAMKNLQERKKAIDNRAKALKQYVIDCMRSMDVKKIETPEMYILVKPTSGKVVINDVEDLPPSYVKVEVVKTPETTKIKQDLKDGKTVSGARLEPGWSLTMK